MEGDVSPTIVGVKKLKCFCYLTVKTAWSIFIHLGTVPKCNRRTE